MRQAVGHQMALPSLPAFPGVAPALFDGSAAEQRAVIAASRLRHFPLPTKCH
jgi:hypothetical protein